MEKVYLVRNVFDGEREGDGVGKRNHLKKRKSGVEVTVEGDRRGQSTLLSHPEPAVLP